MRSICCWATCEPARSHACLPRASVRTVVRAAAACWGDGRSAGCDRALRRGASVRPTRNGSRGTGGLLGCRFEAPLEHCEVGRHFLFRFATDQEQDKDLADPVALELDGDGQAGPVLA